MTDRQRSRACIAGIGETKYQGDRGASLSNLGLQLEASLAAIADAGLERSEIDGVMPFPNLATAEELVANLGCEKVRFAATVAMGGASPVASLALAADEADKRGPYGGAVGYLTHDGEMDTAIVIRSALVQAEVAYVRAGAGVVLDSDPAAEAAETSRKAAAVLEAIAPWEAP